MLTRKDFYSQAPAAIEQGQTCPICLEELEGRRPIRLRCNTAHVFCRTCIGHWANQHYRCIWMCDVRPWDPAPWTNIDPALINKTRQDLLNTTMHTFGVPPGTKADFIAGPFVFTEDDTNVARDGHWVKYLQGRREPDMRGEAVFDVGHDSTLPMIGVGLSEPERMLLPIVNLANAIPILAANTFRPYTASEMADWRLVASNLLIQIDTETVVYMEIEKVAARLKANIRISLADVGTKVEDIPFLQPGPHGTDLDLLVEYVAYTMWRECWQSRVHTRAGFFTLQQFRRQRRLEAREFEGLTWMLEDRGRQCAAM